MTITKRTLSLTIALVAAMAVIIVSQSRWITDIKAERDTYKGNVASLMTGMEQLRQDSTMQASQIRTLQLSVDEYEIYRSIDLKTIESLNIKLKNVQAVSKQEMEVEATVSTPIKTDTVVVRDTIRPVRTFELHNDHIRLDGRIENDSLTANINVPITLTQVLHKIPKHKFLWWNWGCKAVKQVIITDNPYINLKYAEYIELK